MLSNTCKYALRALIYLANFSKENKMIGIKVISEDLKLSSPFLGKILQNLVKQKLLISTKVPMVVLHLQNQRMKFHCGILLPGWMVKSFLQIASSGSSHASHTILPGSCAPFMLSMTVYAMRFVIFTRIHLSKL